MIYKTILYSIIFHFLLNTNLYSQRWKRGTIELLNGNRIEGYIQKDWNGSYGPFLNPIYFKDNPQGPILMYKPGTIKSMSLGKNKIYVSGTIYMSTSEFPYHARDQIFRNSVDDVKDNKEYNGLKFKKEKAF